MAVPPGAQVAGTTVREIAAAEGFPSQCVFIAVYAHEGGRFSIPRGDYVVEEGDELSLISTAENIKGVNDFLTALKENE